MERIARCHCGELCVIAEGEPDWVYLCHCEACQRRTGTAFHFGASYPKERVRLEGAYKVYQRGADSGSNIRFYFCPTCGSNMYWESDRSPGVCGVAAGAFDGDDLPAPTSSIWEDSMHDWLGLPSIGEHHPRGRPPAS